MGLTTLSRRFGKSAAIVGAALALLLGVQQSSAGTAAVPWTRNSTVGSSVVDNGDGTWTYGYKVSNTSFQSALSAELDEPILVDWELPWFGDAGIAGITAPRNWDWSIETIDIPNSGTGWGGVAAWQTPSDPFYAGADSPFTTVMKVLHWYNVCNVQPNRPLNFQGEDVAVLASCESQFDNAIFPNGSLDGFGFTAGFDPTGAPYQASWAVLPVRTGDPAFPLGGGFPNSPALRDLQIPEPGALVLVAIGLGAMALRRRRV